MPGTGRSIELGDIGKHLNSSFMESMAASIRATTGRAQSVGLIA